MILSLCVPSFAEYDTERQKVAQDMENYRFKTVTTPEGLHFNIPEDMPIETRNGLKGPIPFDEYMYYKLRKLEEKLIEVDKKIERMDKELSTSLNTIQKQLEASAKAAQEKPVEQPATKT